MNGRYIEITEDLKETKLKVEKLEKENFEYKKQLTDYKEITKKLEDYEVIKREAAELQQKNKDLKRAADQSAEQAELANSLKNQCETMKKQNLELKDALFQAENKLLHSEISGEQFQGSPTEDKKLNIVEEIKQYLSEVIYVYKTLDTNARELKEIYEEKKTKIEKYHEMIENITSKKNPEKLAILKEIADGFCFINVIGIKADNLKILIPSLIESINIKFNKIEAYDYQLTKFDQMINVAKIKLEEYEQKMNLY